MDNNLEQNDIIEKITPIEMEITSILVWYLRHEWKRLNFIVTIRFYSRNEFKNP